MDYTDKLLEYFYGDENRNHIVVTPHAPPVERNAGGIDVSMDTIWDDTDIRDTLMGLKNYGEENAIASATNPGHEIKIAEVFCMSIKGAGRFRVSYLTQRGSLSFSMKRIPHIVESCDELKLDPTLVERTLNVLCSNNGGIVAVFGPSATANSKLAYALLKRVNTRHRKIIFIVERELSHLMRHDNSLVIQRELGSDCTSFDDGIRECLDMEPDIIFAGDLLMTDHLPSMSRAAETHTSIVLSVVASDKEAFLHILKGICAEHYTIFGRRTREIIQVRPLPDNTIKAEFAAKTK